jgi:hypothetical protein
MTLDRQRCLCPARDDEMRPVLHGCEPVAGEALSLADGIVAEVGQFTLLGISLQAFDWIEFRRSAAMHSDSTIASITTSTCRKRHSSTSADA